jgi:hypothetical protein
MGITDLLKELFGSRGRGLVSFIKLDKNPSQVFIMQNIDCLHGLGYRIWPLINKVVT